MASISEHVAFGASSQGLAVDLNKDFAAAAFVPGHQHPSANAYRLAVSFGHSKA